MTKGLARYDTVAVWTKHLKWQVQSDMFVRYKTLSFEDTGWPQQNRTIWVGKKTFCMLEMKYGQNRISILYSNI